MKTRAALLDDNSGQLHITDVHVDAPLSREVLIRTVGSGLCHSDLNWLDNPNAVSPGLLPVVMGHEVAGIVERVGDEVSYVSIGDHVITYPVQFCGECAYCLRGKPTLCENSPGARKAEQPPRLSLRDGTVVNQFVNLGGFADLMLVHEHGLVKIDADYPLDRAAILGCGVATGLGSVLNAASVWPGSVVAVAGCGGVGLSAIQGAVVSGASRIIAIDTEPTKFDLARTLGATDCVDASGGDAVDQVMEMTKGGVDFSFEAVGLKATAEQCFEMLRAGGVATIIGVGRGQRPAFDMWAFCGERRVQGALMGANRFRSDLPRYINMDLRGQIDIEALIESRINFDDVNQGFDALRSGEVVGRRVIMFP